MSYCVHSIVVEFGSEIFYDGDQDETIDCYL